MMKHMIYPVRRTFLFVSLALSMCLLVSCGFSPLYSNDSAQEQTTIRDNIGDIYIANIPDRSGQFLRNELIDRFYPGGRPAAPDYELVIAAINETATYLDITKSADATRGQLRLTTRMILKNKEDGKILLQRNLIAITSYNILQSQFTTRVSANNARENALNDIARQVEMQLGLYFSRIDDKKV